MTTLPVTTTSPEETHAAGRDFAASLVPGDCVALRGALGAGKTCFARGVIAALTGVDDQFQGSPTFALIQPYENHDGPAVYHADFYRLTQPEELDGIGWNDYLAAQGIVLVEWPDRFPEMLPAATQWLEFAAPDATTRIISRRA